MNHQRFKIQYISQEMPRYPYYQNINIASSGENYGRMSSSGGSLSRKYNFCKNSGIVDVLECTINPDCCRKEDVIPVPVPVPVAPIITQVISGDTVVYVFFTQTEETNPIVDYLYSLNGGPYQSSGLQTTSPLFIQGLVNGTSYTVTIKAVNKNGISVSSNASESFTPNNSVANLLVDISSSGIEKGIYSILTANTTTGYFTINWWDGSMNTYSANEFATHTRIPGVDIQNFSVFSSDSMGDILGDLLYLNCSYNNLVGYYVEGISKLQEAICIGNKLHSLHFYGCIDLINLSCYNNQLSSLDFSGCTQLRSVSCDQNQLSSLDFSGCTQLQDLSCQNNNQLSSLNLSGCTQLQYLFCNQNQLSSLNLSGCTQLQSVSCYNNQLSSLDFSGCTQLRIVSCYNNHLSSLDFSGCTQLINCLLSNNHLSATVLNNIFLILKPNPDPGPPTPTIDFYGNLGTNDCCLNYIPPGWYHNP